MLLGFGRIFNPIFQPRLPVNLFPLRLTMFIDVDVRNGCYSYHSLCKLQYPKPRSSYSAKEARNPGGSESSLASQTLNPFLALFFLPSWPPYIQNVNKQA
jgi:hypothetical protein